MAKLHALAHRHDMAIVLVHHTCKDSAAAAGDAESGHGASAISSAARIVLMAVPMTTEEEKGSDCRKDNGNTCSGSTGRSPTMPG